MSCPGFDFASEVRAIRGDIPVLMVTGYARPEDEDRARAAGIRRVIPKPDTVEELGAIFDQLFRNGDGPDGTSPG